MNNRQTDAKKPDSGKPGRISIFEVIIILPLLFIFLFLFFRPLFQNFNHYIINTFSDNYYFWTWRKWLSMELINTFARAEPFSLKNLVYYGIMSNERFPLCGNTADYMFISYPLSFLFDAPANDNVKILLILLFNGFAAYFTIRLLTRNYTAAFVSAFFAMLNPYSIVIIHSQRPREAILGFMIFYMYYLYRLIMNPHWKTTLKASFFLFLSALFYWFFGMFMVWVTVFVFVMTAFQTMRKKKWADLKKITACLVLCALVFGALSLPFMMAFRAQDLKDNFLFETPRFPPLKEIFSPHQDPYTPQNFSWDSLRLILIQSVPLVFPFSILFCVAALLTYFQKNRTGFLFATTAFFFIVMGYGPYPVKAPTSGYFQVNSPDAFHQIGNNTPDLPFKFFFQNVPFISRLHHPDRYLGGAVAAMALSGGLGIAFLYGRMRKKPQTALLFYILAFVTAFSIFHNAANQRFGKLSSLDRKDGINISYQVLYLPGFYVNIAENPRVFGIVELPFRGMTDRFRFLQSVHNKRVYGGDMEIFQRYPLPEGRLKKIDEQDSFIPPYHRGVVLPGSEASGHPMFNVHERGDLKISPEEIEALKKDNYEFIILHRCLFRNEEEPVKEEDPPGYIIARQELTSLFGEPEIHREPRDLLVARERIQIWGGPERYYEMAVFRIR